VHQLEGRRTLVEILSLAGGLAEDAGYSLKITRRLEWGPIPLKTAQNDATAKYSVAEVRIKEILDASKPDENIVIKPFDVVSVPRAEMVYVTGQVQRAGGYVLRERETLSVLQALSLAGGMSGVASPKRARILRATGAGASREEIPIDLKQIMIGKAKDVPLRAEDILFVPENAPKKAMARAIEAALQVGTTLAIYRP
jgi:polysaccharide export outer membrane protein